MAETAEPRPASPEAPIYTKVVEDPTSKTSLYMVSVDEGWRVSILGCHMYDWAADWLIDQLGRVPFGPEVAEKGSIVPGDTVRVAPAPS